jgi:hypothetical protein
VYSLIIKRLSLLNFNFMALPSDACLTPRIDLIATMHGITISVAGLCLYVIGLWMIGRTVMYLCNWTNVQIRSFDRTSLSHIIFILTISYAPVTEIVLAMFNCRRIGDDFYLAEDMSHKCYVGEHVKIYKESIFWTIFFVVGVPVFCVALLYYYNVPQVAHELMHSSLLRSLVDMAQRKSIPQPSTDLHSLTLQTITDEHVDALYIGLLVEPALETPDRTLSGRLTMEYRLTAVGAALSTLLRWALHPMKLTRRLVVITHDEGQSVSREVKLRRLEQYARVHLVRQHTTWHRVAGDLRMVGARQAIGSIYRDFHSNTWWWIFLEFMNKLLLTGILPFIAKGQAAQVVAGWFMALGLLIIYISYDSYEEKVFRQISSALSFIIFLFFIFMILVKANITVIPMHDDLFKGTCLAILTICTFALPFSMTLRRLAWTVTNDDVAREERAEEEAEAAASAKEIQERADDEMMRSHSKSASFSERAGNLAASSMRLVKHSLTTRWWDQVDDTHPALSA